VYNQHEAHLDVSGATGTAARRIPSDPDECAFTRHKLPGSNPDTGRHPDHLRLDICAITRIGFLIQIAPYEARQARLWSRSSAPTIPRFQLPPETAN